MARRPVDRRAFLQASVAGAALASVAGCTAPRTSPAIIRSPRRRPNIVFVFSDQQRVHDMGTYGGTAVPTPNLDRLAAEGVRCTNALSTYPVCSAYRAMMLTGCMPWNTGMIANDLSLDPRFHSPGGPALGRAAHDAGHRTGYIGKWHVDGRGREKCIERPRRLGFEDRWMALEATHEYFNSKYFEDDSCDIQVWPEYDAIPQTREAQRFIRDNADRPFALVLSWGPPHDPYIAPPEYMAKHDPDRIPIRGNVGHAEFEEEARRRESERFEFPESMMWLRRIIRERMEAPNAARVSAAGYYAASQLLDDLLGQLRRTLEEEGILDDTIFVYSSDHGDQLWSHNFYGKQVPFEESINIPMVVRYPRRLPAGVDSDVLFRPVDVMPTLLGMAGIEHPPVDGSDLTPTLAGEPGGPDPDAALIMRMAHISNTWAGSGTPTFRGVRTKTHTYARHTDGEPWLLFDNMADPLQMRNLVGSPGHAGLQAALHARTAELVAEANDPDDDYEVIDRILRVRPDYGSVRALLEANPRPG